MPLSDCDRDHIATVWLRDYGEPLDCEALADAASLANVKRRRLMLASNALAPRLAALLDRQARDLLHLLDEPIPGSSETTMQQVLAAAEASTAPVRGEAIYAPTLWIVLGLAQKMERSRDLLERCRMDSGHKLADSALAHAAHTVSEWVRDRTSSGDPSWKDTLTCLEWYGHDLGGMTPDALRKRAEAWPEWRANVWDLASRLRAELTAPKSGQ